MSEIVVQNLVKKFGGFTALNNVSLTIKKHEFVVLLGPSGCGKTTLLRAIAGLGLADSGTITIGGRDVTYLPPRERNLSMVFQNYAIFPHMTVFDNIAFGLKMKKAPQTVIRERVNHAANLLHIEKMLDRYPAQMSGGQRQRIAVARAIAIEAEVVLMDEPLSNLDALLRLEMRAELKSLLQRLGVTTIYVTHDQIEAMSMGDRIAVMREGNILQYDEPMRIYDDPADRFVGGFIGNPPMNFMPGTIHQNGNGLEVQVGNLSLTPPSAVAQAIHEQSRERVLVGIRAEAMDVHKNEQPGSFPVEVEVVEPLGSMNLLTIRIEGAGIKVATRPDFPVRIGDTVWLNFPREKIRWMDIESEKEIGGQPLAVSS